MKSNVAGFIAQNEFAHGGESAIGRVISQQPVVSGADQLRQQQHLQLKSDAQDSPAKTKGRKAPVRGDITSVKPLHRAAQQAGVLRFLGKPEVNDRAHFGAATPEPFRVIGNQGSRSAAISEAELLERFEQRRENGRGNRHGRRPVRFEAIISISGKMRDPFGVIHIHFVLQSI